MADTPILNYKGKHDGPEIDKAVELALGLENPKSCPYYVHVSLSQPDYILTIGLGDAEGNLFNHTEIDLPLESMVVNATYENGNIILHLQDGTSTEPIPISALIAGLVSETRTIAGVDLKDDITPKELRDALDVYTKDSVDQLVSDLEDRINETLDEMEKSLNDLSDLTSEHDKQIKKNTNDTEINSLTLGMKVAKNLFNKDGQINLRYNGTIESNEEKKNTVNNNIVTFNTASSNDAGTGQMISGLKHKKVIISFECVSVGTSSSNLGKLIIYKRNSNTALMSEFIRLGDFAFEYDCGDNDELLFAFVVNGSGVGLQLKNIMIRFAEFNNPMYVPYSTPVPSVNERLVEVEESVSELTSQVEQNKSDILSAKNDIAINRATLGVQCVNIFDGELKEGDINPDTGIASNLTGAVISNNYIQVSKNATISVLRSENNRYMSWRFYDENKNYIGIANSSDIQVIHGGNAANVLIDGMNFGCFKIINPNIRYIRFRDASNSLTNVYMFVEGEYTQDTMPAYEPYKPSLQEQINALIAEIAELKMQITTE